MRWSLLLVSGFALCGSAHADWGGGIAASAAETREDTARQTSVEQTYDIFLSGRTLTRLQYNAAFRYRWLQADNHDANPVAAQQEFQPSGGLAWISRPATVRGSYTYREYRDRQLGRLMTGRNGELSAQTNNLSIPQLVGRYSWTQNVQGLDLQGQDTRSRTLGVGTRYNLRRVSMSYDFSDNLARNANTGLERTFQQHSGRLNASVPLLKNHATVESGYQINSRRQREKSPSTSATLLSVPAVAGLYAEDPTPDFGSLGTLPALIDNDVNLPASFTINLSGPEVHNFGLGFGIPVAVDRLYLYTDTDSLVNRSLRWAVFVSDDSLTWRMVQGYAPGTYDVFFQRYEIGFPTQTTRFIKLVDEPALQQSPVHPTELQALAVRRDGLEPAQSTDHRGELAFRASPAKWINASVGGSILRSEGSFIRQAQEQDGANSDIRVHPDPRADITARVSWDRSVSRRGDRQELVSENAGLAWQAQWLPTLNTRATAGSTLNRVNSVADRRNDALNGRLTAQLLPGLTGVSEIGYIEDHYLRTGDLVTTRLFGQSVDAQPTTASTFGVQFRYYALDARYTQVPSYRRITNVRGSYRLTALISAAGDASLYEEPHRSSRTLNGLLSWTPSDRWMFSGGITRAEGTGQSGSTLLNGQALLRWNYRTDISFSYSRTSYDEANLPDISSARLGFNARF